MLRRKKKSSIHKRASVAPDGERETPSVSAAKELRQDAHSSLSLLESYFGKTARITVYVREHKKDVPTDSSSADTTSNASSSPGDMDCVFSDKQYEAYLAHVTYADKRERRRADLKFQKRVQSKRERERRRVYKKQDLIFACIEMATGSETAVSPSGCLTYAEAIESAALAFLVSIDSKEQSLLDASLETSLRSTTSSKSSSPSTTPHLSLLPDGLRSSGSRPIDARPNTARAEISNGAVSSTGMSPLARSTSDVQKLSRLRRAYKGKK